MRKIRKATGNGGEGYSFAETYGRYPIVERPPKPLAKPREKQLRAPGEGIAVVSVVAAIFGGGAVTGHFLGSHTSEIARGKVTTAQACVAAVGRQNVITQALDACMEKGVPGGDPIGANKMAVGDPITSVNDYVVLQEGSIAHAENDDTYGTAAKFFLGTALPAISLAIIGVSLEATRRK
jgi:hypothetical protein